MNVKEMLEASLQQEDIGSVIHDVASLTERVQALSYMDNYQEWSKLLFEISELQRIARDRVMADWHDNNEVS